MIRRPAAIPAAPAPMITTSVSLLLAKFVLREFARVVRSQWEAVSLRSAQAATLSKTSACVPVS